ncbi:HEPN domain-containing protein [Amycolatopsis sp. CA-126428]|uniref:HEPN domain-containing protein n=1 Tax=Amycolatopsis sp. CA-126428 TaxID=2073158 RepID=UPI0011B0523D|nr:HEPN domain-containing protein [Amycolatopsis sp. CA-126428]
MSGGSRGQVLNFLSGLAGSPPVEASYEIAAFQIISTLSGYDQTHATSVVNHLRILAGGSSCEVEAVEDPVLKHLLTIARDVWPIYLISLPIATPPNIFPAVLPGIYQHAEMAKLCEVIASDGELVKLFPGIDRTGRSFAHLDAAHSADSVIFDSTGRGGSLQPSTLAGFMLSHAASRALISNGSLTWRTMSDKARETVEATRLLAKGRTVKMPTLVGISGLRISNSLTFPVADGILRAPRPIDRKILPPNVENLSAVYETSFPVQIIHIGDAALPLADFSAVFTKHQSKIDESRRSFQRSFDMLRAALLLGSPSHEPLLVNDVARFTTNPLVAGGVQTWSSIRPGIPSHELVASHVEELRKWHEMIVGKHHSSLDVGLRRLLSATTLRADPSDAFVDAVIAWENMFGAKTETSFRVTGSIAKLLGPEDPDGRIDFRRNLVTLYEKRSRLVHGGKEPSAKELEQFRTRAIEIATECFRKLYRDRPDLLPLESELRSARILVE